MREISDEFWAGHQQTRLMEATNVAGEQNRQEIGAMRNPASNGVH